LEVGQAISRAREVGFKYNDFKDLWEAYHQAWDGDFANWGSEKPPIHDPVTPIPWNGTLELKARIEALKAELETGPMAHLTYKSMRDYMLRQTIEPSVSSVR
jgi:hypothetical protein